MNKIGVYFLYDDLNEIVYVGKSKDYLNKLKNHNISDNSYKYISVMEFDTEPDAIVAEVYFICKLKPKYNIKGNTPWNLSIEVNLGNRELLFFYKNLQEIGINQTITEKINSAYITDKTREE